MALRPEASVGVGLATAALVASIYSRHLPTSADLRVADQGDPDAESARKQAMWASAGVVAAISLMTKDPTIFVIGGAMTVAIDWADRVDIWTNPFTKSARDLGPEDQAYPTQAASPDMYGQDLVVVQ